MKTTIVTTCYLNEGRYSRMVDFCKYYLPKLESLGAEKIIILDNASDENLLTQFLSEINDSRVQMIQYTEHIGRPTHLEYGYLWRAVWELKNLPYEKIIYMDNDFYMLSERIFDYVKNLKEGWTTFWCPKYGFPETGCHILVKPCQNYETLVSSSWKPYNGQCMEKVLPVTHKNRDMIGDRWIEYKDPKIPENADFAAQGLI